MKLQLKKEQNQRKEEEGRKDSRGKRLKIIRILIAGLIFLLVQSVDVWASSEEKEEEKKGFAHFIRNTLNMKNSFQVGYEFDDNVEKVFNTVGKNNDHLIRSLLDSKIKYYFTKRNYLGLNYQIGGKIYMKTAKEDSLINNVILDYGLEPKNNWYFNTRGNLKLKLEKEDVSSSGNENYILTGCNALAGKRFPNIINISINPQYTYFFFNANHAYGFHRGRYGINFRRKIFWRLFGETSYYFQHQKFLEVLTSGDPKRSDWLNEASIFFTIDSIVIVKTGYIFQDSHSNISGLDYRNHKVTLQASTVFWKDLTLMVLGTLQMKLYPEASSVTDEGERFLVTEAEEENFNSIIVKASKRIVGNLYLEFKFSRFSNDFSDKEDDYSKYLYYGGLRYVF